MKRCAVTRVWTLQDRGPAASSARAADADAATNPATAADAARRIDAERAFTDLLRGDIEDWKDAVKEQRARQRR